VRVVVVGLGAMGLPAARVLADRGHDVVGIDRHGVGAPAGSSSGSSRVFRLSHADRELVRLALAAQAAWRRLEQRAGEELVLVRGLLERGQAALDTARALAAEGVPYRELDEADVAALFPELAPWPGAPAIIQPDGGTALAAATLAAELRLARAAGVEVAERERAVAVEPAASGARVVTDRRTLDADVAVVCAGPWATELLAPLGLVPPLVPVPAQVTYFACPEQTYARPCVVDWRTLEDTFYGMPVPGRGYKLGLLDWTRPWDPDADAVPESADEQRRLAALVSRFLPGLGPPVGSQTCPVTLTADGKFVLDRRGPVVVGAGCSGQGFKFAPLFGELLADLAEDRERDPLLAQFRLDRPGLDRPIGSIRDLVLHGAAT
jgi:sarcosine oxidase